MEQVLAAAPDDLGVIAGVQHGLRQLGEQVVMVRLVQDVAHSISLKAPLVARYASFLADARRVGVEARHLAPAATEHLQRGLDHPQQFAERVRTFEGEWRVLVHAAERGWRPIERIRGRGDPDWIVSKDGRECWLEVKSKGSDRALRDAMQDSVRGLGMLRANDGIATADWQTFLADRIQLPEAKVDASSAEHLSRGVRNADLRAWMSGVWAEQSTIDTALRGLLPDDSPRSLGRDLAIDWADDYLSIRLRVQPEIEFFAKPNAGAPDFTSDAGFAPSNQDEAIQAFLARLKENFSNAQMQANRFTDDGMFVYVWPVPFTWDPIANDKVAAVWEQVSGDTPSAIWPWGHLPTWIKNSKAGKLNLP